MKNFQANTFLSKNMNRFLVFLIILGGVFLNNCAPQGSETGIKSQTGSSQSPAPSQNTILPAPTPTPSL